MPNLSAHDFFTFSSFSQSSKSYKVLQKLAFTKAADYDISQPITFNDDLGWMFVNDFKILVYGALLFCMMRWAPDGFAGIISRWIKRLRSTS